MKSGAGRRYERVGWEDDFIARPDPRRPQRKLERHRAVDARHGMRRLLVGGKAPFELLIQAAGRSSPLPAAQGREEELFFRMTELGPRRGWLRPAQPAHADGPGRAPPAPPGRTPRAPARLRH